MLNGSLVVFRASQLNTQGMTNAGAVDDTRLSQPLFTWERLFGLLVGGVCAPPIGLSGAYAATPIFAPTPGAFNASPAAFAEALWVCGLMISIILSVWSLLAVGRRSKGIGPRSALALGWCLAIALLIYLLDAHDGDFDGAVLHPVFFVLVAMMWIISIPTAFALGSLAIAATYISSKQSAVSLVASGAIVAVVVSVMFPGTPLFMGGDGIVAALGFWLPTGVFTMGCCAAASGARWTYGIQAL
jgi:hypothetical protein